ncbi:cytochrome c family protein [Erythrobacter sp. HKB08]|uniref:c-type cytochrome n=1 Tax=Erythrobacter sp. HKB08 TaxID=2502843 RepID=UPI001008E66C|nr:cytochrome c family protein [Erythrobacter sp. HKB08]
MQDRTNTIAGWVLFSGIMALGLSIVSGMYFHAGDPEVPENPGYAVEVAEDEGGESGPSLAELLATGSAASGEAVFAKCTACHTIEQGGANGIGPNLYGVMGQSIGKHVAGFAYSEALSSNGGTWTWENMDAWLKSPRGFANGTKMSFAGLSKPEDRANLMLYLETFGGAPSKPAYDPEAAAAEAAEGEVDGAGEGPGPVEGADVDPVEAAGAMGADQPVPSE